MSWTVQVLNQVVVDELAALPLDMRARESKGDQQMTMISAKALHRKWMKNPAYRAEYEALTDEFGLIGALIEARDKAGLTQAQLAARMKTTQAAIARLESGRVLPSTRTLQKFAKATGTVLKISFQPRATEPGRRSTAKPVRRAPA